MSQEQEENKSETNMKNSTMSAKEKQRLLATKKLETALNKITKNSIERTNFLKIPKVPNKTVYS